jgi:AcrR family transcriptional regulator
MITHILRAIDRHPQVAFCSAKPMPPKPGSTPRKQPKQERSQTTVEAILTATAHILIESGLEKFTTNRVAELAGVSIGSLYQYFPNKKALLFALAQQQAEQMLQLAQEHLTEVEHLTIPEVVQHIVQAAIAAHSVNPRLHQVLHQQMSRDQVMPAGAEPQVENLLRSFLEQRRDQLKPNNLDLTVFIVSCTIESLIQRAILEQSTWLTNGELEQEITTLLSGYLLPSPS